MKLLQSIIKQMEKNNDVVFGYLFGSFAREEARPDSDLDIALYFHKWTLDKELQIRYELSKALHKEVDLLVLNHCKNLFLLEGVLNEGILIKDDEKRIDFELSRRHDILDYKAFKKYIDAA